MKSNLTDHPFLRESLRRAHFSREREGVGEDWSRKVMRRVREIGPLRVPGFWPDFERVVWRLAPVSGILVLAMALLLFLNTGPGVSDDYLGNLTADADQPTMGELLGVES